jgi:hypothetical protein
MADIFGKTAMAGIPDSKPVRLVIEGLAPEENLFLTNIAGNVAPNFQIMYSFGRDIFLNAFTQRLSVFKITGIYVSSSCEGDTSGRGEPVFLSFYRKNNIVSSKGAIKITFNGITITGFLIMLEVENYNKEGIDGHNFSLQFLGMIGGLEKASNPDRGSSTHKAAASALLNKFSSESTRARFQAAAAPLASRPTGFSGGPNNLLSSST